MCNSSSITTNSTLFFRENVSWFCMCQDRVGTIIAIVSSMLCFIVGTPINCWCLWVFLRRNFTPNTVFPLNILILELVFCIECFVDFLDYKISSTASYSLTTFFIGITWTLRPLLQICICFEQYLAVIHPVTFLRYKSIQYRIALLVAVWLIAIGNSVRLVSIRINYFRDHVCIIVFCIVVTVTSFCCVSVLHALQSPGPSDRKNIDMTRKDRENKTDRVRAVENQQKRKAFRIISDILVSILVCYFPQVVAYFLCIAVASTHLFLCDAVPMILFITKISIIISPLIRMYCDGHLKHITCFSNIREN